MRPQPPLQMCKYMLLGRAFEQRMEQLAPQGLIPGPVSTMVTLVSGDSTLSQ